MTYDENRIDDAVLALLFFTSHPDGEQTRAWKGHSWDARGRLHAAGWINNPVGKAKSVVFTPDGLKRATELAEQLFAKTNE